MSLQDIVNVQISKEGKGVTQAGFGTPLILGSSIRLSPDIIRPYSNLAGVAVDFQSTDAEYLAAQAIFSQSPCPNTVKIGRRLAEVVEVITVTPNVATQAIQHYIETINGVAYDFTSDATPTAAEVVTGLIALINADSNAPCTASGSATLILTAKVAGVGFTHSESANLVAVQTTANHGVQDDLAAIQLVDDDWYGIMLTSRADHDILNCAAWTEAEKKVYVACSADSNATVIGNQTSAFYQVKQHKYARTYPFWSDKQVNFPDAALLGACLPLQPGSETWAFKSLAGQVASVLNAGQLQALRALSANYYITIAGVDITLNGTVADNEYIDSIRFIDYFQARLEERIFGTLINSPKIPYTDQGAAVIESDIRAQILNGIGVGGIADDGNISVTIPLVANQNPNDRAARRFPGIEFTWRLAGAIQEVDITGFVTV